MRCHKGHILSIVLASFMLLSSYSFTFAETSNLKRVEVKTEIKSRVEERKEKLSNIRQERIRSSFGKMVVKMEATLERLTKLTEKMETRITKIKESDKNNKDTEIVTLNVAKAKILLSSTETDLVNLKNKLEKLVSSDDPKTVFLEVKSLFETIKNNLKEVHQLLVHSIGSIKGLRTGDSNKI